MMMAGLLSYRTVVLTIVVATASNIAATNHVVGGSTGWNNPPSFTFFSDWANSQTFLVGDTLEFDFQNGQYNVIQVPESSYDSCSTNNQIGNTISFSPTSIVLTATGQYYYISGLGYQCSFGQKLAINVIGTFTPPGSGIFTPPGSGTFNPPGSGTFTPGRSTSNHVVGGTTGWNNLQNPTFYSSWAGSQTFAVGDTLEFDFQSGQHDVIQVPKSSYDSCSTSNQIGNTLSTGPASISLSGTGQYYFICGFSGHCSNGEKLAVNVNANNFSPGPSTRNAGSKSIRSGFEIACAGFSLAALLLF